MFIRKNKLLKNKLLSKWQHLFRIEIKTLSVLHRWFGLCLLGFVCADLFAWEGQPNITERLSPEFYYKSPQDSLVYFTDSSQDAVFCFGVRDSQATVLTTMACIKQMENYAGQGGTVEVFSTGSQYYGSLDALALEAGTQKVGSLYNEDLCRLNLKIVDVQINTRWPRVAEYSSAPLFSPLDNNGSFPVDVHSCKAGSCQVLNAQWLEEGEPLFSGTGLVCLASKSGQGKCITVAKRHRRNTDDNSKSSQEGCFSSLALALTGTAGALTGIMVTLLGVVIWYSCINKGRAVSMLSPAVNAPCNIYESVH